MSDSCIEKHKGERKVITGTDEETLSVQSDQANEEVEVEIPDSDGKL